MKTFLLFGFLFGGGDHDFTGTYAVRGDAPNGTYTATMEIERFDDLYKVTWTYPHCDFVAGVGIVRNKELVIGYETPAGVVVYRVTHKESPRTMEATYAGWGFDRAYSEQAVEGTPPPCVPQAPTANPHGPGLVL